MGFFINILPFISLIFHIAALFSQADQRSKSQRKFLLWNSNLFLDWMIFKLSQASSVSVLGSPLGLILLYQSFVRMSKLFFRSPRQSPETISIKLILVALTLQPGGSCRTLLRTWMWTGAYRYDKSCCNESNTKQLYNILSIRSNLTILYKTCIYKQSCSLYIFIHAFLHSSI